LERLPQGTTITLLFVLSFLSLFFFSLRNIACPLIVVSLVVNFIPSTFFFCAFAALWIQDMNPFLRPDNPLPTGRGGFVGFMGAIIPANVAGRASCVFVVNRFLTTTAAD
jgi:hypothetical protein